MSIKIEIHIVDLRCASLLARGDLSESELARANRFSSPLLARRFASSRVALRRLLGQRLGCAEPCNIPLTIGPHGKPRLDSSAPYSDVRFNSSRSKDVALIALTEEVEVGIDIEASNPLFGDSTLAERVLASEERVALQALPTAQRVIAFGHYWVRKEAVLKAVGTGLLIPPERIDTSAGDEQAFGSVLLKGFDGETRRVWWQDIPLCGFDGYAAVAYTSGGH